MCISELEAYLTIGNIGTIGTIGNTALCEGELELCVIAARTYFRDSIRVLHKVQGKLHYLLIHFSQTLKSSLKH